MLSDLKKNIALDAAHRDGLSARLSTGAQSVPRTHGSSLQHLLSTAPSLSSDSLGIFQENKDVPKHASFALQTRHDAALPKTGCQSACPRGVSNVSKRSPAPLVKRE
ncbi:hypothetical protein CEXT_587301 [Caerostris extrusa]|uniref:Uncharacterized protein n=1 Tax=Caerostris extrusa TaxID=172846 RepID=A0AAV4RMN5_CAEEX|nr:hypothetical protein CEXT_587301 [Caerostris extrusa]